MKLLKPSWVNHDDKPIFSVDIHPTGKRFATGGQGGDSGRVVVWNLNSVLYENVELDPNVPKKLCQMDNHLACVNCVRWSNNGRYLASGGDDRLVMVWVLSIATGAGVGKHKAETWRCLSTLRGHAGDVLDLAWSPLDKWLASCSVDNSVIIWNAEKFPEMVSVLNGHTGLVKGVAWDPVGKYLASQSDDKSLRVWKTADWAPETVITEPFDECGGTTHVLRLSWSPDGQYVVSAHAMNGGGPTAQVVERDGWRCDKDFVGHRKAVTCARFNNNIFVKEGKKCCCAAVGSRDRALSIWLTSLKRPLLVIHDLFDDSVLDISWSSDGLNLLACSSDGTVACMQFTNLEIGTPLTLDEKNVLYEKIYGSCLTRALPALLVEGADVLRARRNITKPEEEKKNDKSEKEKVEKPVMQPTPPITCASASRPVDRQIETRTSDGKRRITPVFIPLTNVDANESLGSASGGADNCFSSSSQSKSRILVERRDDIVFHPNVSNHATPRVQQNENGLDARLRRINTTSLPGPAALDSGGVTQTPGVTSTPGVQVTPPRPALPVPTLGAAGPVVRMAGAYRLQVVNKACNTSYGPLSKLQLLPNNSISNDSIWETYLGSAVSCIACSGVFACVGCVDGSLHAWQLHKLPPTRILPHMVLPSPAAKLFLSGGRLCVCTAAADLLVLTLAATKPTATRPKTFRPLLRNNVTVTNCTLLEDGNPMISFSNGKSYIYSEELYSWVVWSDPGDPVWRAGGRLAPPRTPGGGWGKVAPPTTGNHISAMGNSSTNACAARSWLEAQVAAARTLRRRTDFRHWLLTLFGHLVNHGTEEQLRSILNDMMGPSHCTSVPTKWESTVLDINKHDMLEEMLSLIVRELRWQRLYTEYADQLAALRDFNSNPTPTFTTPTPTLPTSNGHSH